MDQAGKLIAEINEAQLQLEALRRSKQGMVRQYAKAERLAEAHVQELWVKYRALQTDVSGLQPVHREE